MARPIKDGLDYFPKDSDFYRDRKIRALIGRFSTDGVALYDYILCEVYGDKGYYLEVDDSFRDIAAADLRMSPEKIGLILDYLLNQSMLLDSTLFKAVKVLTSRGIQTRYQEAVRQRAVKRGVCVDGKLWLLEEAETESFIQVRHSEDLSRKNPDKSEKNSCLSMEQSLKESKGKESKEKKRKKQPPAPPAESFGFGEDLTAAFTDWLAYKQEKRQAYKPTGQKNLIAQVRKNAQQYGEPAVAELIRECMAANWQGIIFDKLNERRQQDGRTGSADSDKDSWSNLPGITKL